MEDTNAFNLPDFNKPEEKPKRAKPTKTVEKELLPIINREVTCSYCNEIKILNPSQYQKRYDYFGSEVAIANHFKCQQCETKEKENPFRFAFDHYSIVNELANKLKNIFDEYNNNGNILNLQNRTTDLLTSHKFSAKNYEFVVANNRLEGIKFNLPFVGDVLIKPLEFFKDKKITIL